MVRLILKICISNCWLLSPRLVKDLISFGHILHLTQILHLFMFERQPSVRIIVFFFLFFSYHHQHFQGDRWANTRNTCWFSMFFFYSFFFSLGLPCLSFQFSEGLSSQMILCRKKVLKNRWHSAPNFVLKSALSQWKWRIKICVLSVSYLIFL